MTATDLVTYVETCERCNEKHVDARGRPTCLGHKRPSSATPQPCKALPIPGGTVCRVHGGVRQAQGAAIQALRREEAALEAMNMLGIHDYDITPEEAILQVVRESAANVAFLRARVQEIIGMEDIDSAFHPLVWGISSESDTQATQFPGTDTTKQAGAHVWYQMYQDALKMMLSAATMAQKAGIAERRVRLAEQSADVIVGRIRQVVNALNLTPEQVALADRVIPLQIAALARDLEAT